MEMRLMPKEWSKTLITVKAICVWLSSLKSYHMIVINGAPFIMVNHIDVTLVALFDVCHLWSWHHVLFYSMQINANRVFDVACWWSLILHMHFVTLGWCHQNQARSFCCLYTFLSYIMSSFNVWERYVIQKQYMRLAYHAAASDDTVSDIERQH